MTPRLTIVLPLKGRHLFTLRFLWHANQARLPYRFLIADGQVDPKLADLLEDSTQHFPNLEIQYIRYPDDLDFSCFFAKMADALGRVTTPYAMLVDNDDFLAFGGIERALDFLDANADYVCSSGRVAGFSVYSGFANRSGGLRGKLNRLYDYYPGAEDVSSPSLAERVRRGGLKLWIYYAVTRTAALARVAREAADINFTDLLVFEAFHVMRILTLGKARSDEAAVSYVRQYGTSLYTSFKKDWVHHLIRSQFTADIRALVEHIATPVAAADKIDPAQVAEEIRTVLESKFRQFFWASYGSRQAFKQAVQGRTPQLISWWQNRPRYFLSRQRKTLLRQLENADALQNGVASFRAEIAAIEQVVTGAAFADFIRPYVPQLNDFAAR